MLLRLVVGEVQEVRVQVDLLVSHHLHGLTEILHLQRGLEVGKVARWPNMESQACVCVNIYVHFESAVISK